MAAVSFPPSPHRSSAMSNRRQPLTDIPNAANSPYRGAAAVAAAASMAVSKRARSHSSIQRELSYGAQPANKRSLAEVEAAADPQTPPRSAAVSRGDERGVGGRPRAAPGQLTGFDRKLAATRERQDRAKSTRSQQATAESLETVRQWQKHYRRVFPKCVLYFEGIPDELHLKCSKQVAALGAREERFFSKDVTHVITTRAIPPECPPATASTAASAPLADEVVQTINPSLLEKASDGTQPVQAAFPPRGKFTFEPAGLRKMAADVRHGSAGFDWESRRPLGAQGDVLLKAREMGMKIWALEKLQRMMTTMFDTDTGAQAPHGHNTRSHSGHFAGNSRTARATDLSQLLRDERTNGPSDRDHTVASKDTIHFKGPFIYVRDLDERQRPIMVREYPKVVNKSDGVWPQFRSVMNGKCPFVEDQSLCRREGDGQAKPQAPAPTRLERRAAAAPAPLTAESAVGKTRRLQAAPAQRRVLTETADAHNRAAPRADEAAKTMAFAPPPQPAPANHDRAQGLRAFVQPDHQRVGEGRPALRFFGGEPIASGLQQSNVTSAIRSQMISSTAAAPGAKAGTSKEVYELKRKVLEKNSVPAMTGYRSASAAGAARSATARNERIPANFRAAKRKAQEKLGFIDEDFTPSEEEENARQVDAIEKAKASRHRRVERREPKPGYCENCRDKFEDFEEHTLSRKHRKFAVSEENWTDLDRLLRQLHRPLKA